MVDHESSVIRLVHYTTQEYFEQIMNTWNPDADFDIVTTCLTYLSFSAFRRPCETQEELRERLGQNRFLVYAISYCGEHIRPVESKVASRVCQLLLQNNLLRSLSQVPIQKLDFCTTGLHWAADFGLSGIAQELLGAMKDDERIAVNAIDSLAASPLTYAAKSGRYSLAKFLLEKGAEVDNGNALREACIEGHEQIVKLLLDHSADVNHGGALYHASSKGHERIVKMLLNKGADVNGQFERCGSALQAASASTQESIVKLLIDKGTKVDFESIEVACSRGYKNIVDLLLEESTAMDVTGTQITLDYAMHIATYHGHEKIVKLLLDKGAKVDAEIIETASSRGLESIVRLLLEKIAFMGMTGMGPRLGYALHGASQIGNEQIVKLLLENGADVNTKSYIMMYGESASALVAASYKGYASVVKLLLSKGAEVDDKAIGVAKSGGHHQIFALLREKMAESTTLEI